MLGFYKNHFILKNWSLKRRLTLVSAIVILLAFYAIYVVTKTAYINASKTSVQESLAAQIYALLAVAEDQDAQLSIPTILRNDRLNHLNSGLVAYVLDIDGRLIWRSRSSDNLSKLPDISLSYSLQKLIESRIDGQTMFWVGDKVIWEHETGVERQYLFLIGEKKSIMNSQVRQYKKVIATWLWVTTFILILVLFFALNFSLRPLKDAQKQIELVRRGDKERVTGEFPVELKPLTSSINSLLDSETVQKQRYRDTLGNLAHSLKTPLAIITSELQKEKNELEQEIVMTQVERISQIVSYQLNRSVVSAGQTLKRKSLVEPEVLKIVEALNKVHAAKSLSITAEIAAESFFPGETGDLMELVGNLADNACKWAETKVELSITSNQTRLEIKIEDDGPGIPPEKRALILDRGKRLDQQAEGQGLGLSIVMDILKTYRGNLDIESSSSGGAIFLLTIPL